MAAREPYNVTARAAAATPQNSPWRSPVPYLFGGLTAMFGLIAFALVILACSYWKLSGYFDGGGEGSGIGGVDLEAGEEGKGGDTQKLPAVMEEKILVIMAGQLEPTYLATPRSSRTPWFRDEDEKSCFCDEKQNERAISGGGGVKLVKQGEGDVQVRIGSTANHVETSDQAR